MQLSQRQLDEAIDSSCNSSTRLIRNPLAVFFSNDVLAGSSAYGGSENPALDKDILAACLRKLKRKLSFIINNGLIIINICDARFVQSKHQVTKTVLIDAMNDKCAQARRKAKKIKK